MQTNKVNKTNFHMTSFNVMRLLLFSTLLVFLAACVSTPPKKGKSNTQTHQKERARMAFDELEGRPTQSSSQPARQTQTQPEPEVTQQREPVQTYNNDVSDPYRQPEKPADPKPDYNSNRYLKAKGMGLSEQEAVRQAKAELSNIFESRIMSDVTSKTRQVTDSVKGGSYTKSIQSDIRVISDIQLEGVKIIKTFKDGREYAAIAALDRKQAREKWNRDIKKTNDKIEVLQRKSNNAKGKYLKLNPLKSILKHWIEREVIVSRLRVIGYNPPKMAAYDLKSLLIKMDSLKTKMLIDLDISGAKGKDVRDLVAEILTDKGFKIGDFESQADVLISGSVKISKVKNRNKNFKFSRATVSLNIIDAYSNNQIGQIRANDRGAHLNYDEAAHQAIKKVSKKVSKEFMKKF